MNSEQKRFAALCRANGERDGDETVESLTSDSGWADRVRRLEQALNEVAVPESLTPVAGGGQRRLALLRQVEIVPRWVPATALAAGALIGVLAFSMLDRAVPVPPIVESAVVESLLPDHDSRLGDSFFFVEVGEEEIR